MAGNMSKEAATQEADMQMTPMIDVTFLLLIFFLCSIKFKLLDGKMQTYLPRDVGVNTTPMDEELEKIDIQMVINKRAPFGFDVAVNGSKMADMDAFYRRVRGLHQAAPELKATVYPGKKIKYGQVVRVVNECLRADLTQISFGGAAAE